MTTTSFLALRQDIRLTVYADGIGQIWIESSHRLIVTSCPSHVTEFPLHQTMIFRQSSLYSFGHSKYRLKWTLGSRLVNSKAAYDGHIPLNWFETGFLAVGSAIMSIFDPRRGGERPKASQREEVGLKPLGLRYDCGPWRDNSWV